MKANHPTYFKIDLEKYNPPVLLTFGYGDAARRCTKMEKLFPNSAQVKKVASATRGLRSDAIKFYGSFTARYPCEMAHDQFAKLPSKMKISENDGNSEDFYNRFYYFTLES